MTTGVNRMKQIEWSEICLKINSMKMNELKNKDLSINYLFKNIFNFLLGI